MLKKHRMLKGMVLVLGVLLGTIGLSSQKTYAASTVNATASSIKVGTNGDLDAARSALLFGVDGTGEMYFKPVPTYDEDWQPSYEGTIAAAYKINTKSSNNFYRFTITNLFGESLTASVYTAGMSIVATTDVGQLTTETIDLKLNPSSTYYFVVNGSNDELDPGTATISIKAISDDGSDTLSKAKSVSIDKTVTKNLECAGDTDCFKIKTLKDKAFYNITTWAVTTDNITVSVVDTNNKTIYSTDITQGESETEDLNLKKNTTYYVRVTGGDEETTGKYKFKIVSKKDTESDTKTGATKIKIGNTATGAIQTSLDEDVFKFTTGKYTTLQVTVKNKSNKNEIEAYVTDKNGKIVSDEETVETGDSSVFSLSELGTKSNYYIHIKGSTGDAKYTVSVKVVKCKITYVLNKGKLPEDSPKTFTVSEETELVTPSRDGYTFLGWYTTSNFSDGTKISSIPSTQETNLKVYARWKKDKSSK